MRSGDGRQIEFDELAAIASRADLVFVGEQHDDPETHFAEFALLDAIGRARTRVVVSLEMFERDVQPVLDSYLAGHIAESEMLAKSRPWPNYATDYRPLVLLARARGWPVIASNVPRPMAAAVSRRGLAVLDTIAGRQYAAHDISCPHDAYYARFADEMKGHGSGGPASASDSASALAITDRFYDAQCVKDETMGESVANAFRAAGPGAVVVHFDGAFHSDFAQGTVARAIRRVPNASRVVISMVPVPDPASANVAEYAARGDYIVFTRAAK